MKITNTNTSPPVLLLVDDNEEILSYIARGLKPEYQIIKAFNGKEAIDILKNRQVQLIVSDVMMDIIDGFELCRHVKSEFEYSHIPVILLTAKNTLQSKIEGLELGADAYIEKPFSPKHLQAQIGCLLRNRNMIRSYYASSPSAPLKTLACTAVDEKFLEQLYSTINQNIENVHFDVESLAKSINMSRATLYRKIKAITNLTPHELINIARLKKAAILLAENRYRVSEVSNMLGYSSQNHFSRLFLKQFGISPSKYSDRHKITDN